LENKLKKALDDKKSVEASVKDVKVEKTILELERDSFEGGE